MLRTAVLGLLLLLAGGSPVLAQSRVYLAATTAVDGANRGNIPSGAVPSIGGMVGFRLTDAWNVEVEAERGFRTTDAGSGEAVLVSFPPVPNPSFEQIQAYGIRTR